MSIYALDELISQARSLAAEYRKTTGKPLPGVSNEIAEHDACRLLELKLVKDRTDGYDAVGTSILEGRRIQIKARAIFDEAKGGHRIGQLKLEKPWDHVVLVLMDDNYDSFEIYEAQRDVILKHIPNTSPNRAKRGAMSIAKFKNIGRLLWSKEQGLLDNIDPSQVGQS